MLLNFIKKYIIGIIIFFISLLIFITFNEMIKDNKMMGLLISFSNNKNIYCENNILINKRNGWYLHLTDKVFIKEDKYIIRKQSM